MSRAKPLSSIPPLGFVLGAKVDISRWHGGELVLDVNQRVQCFLGYHRDEQPHDLPWYSPSVALHDRDGRSSYRFVELRRGVLQRTGFLRDDQYYKIIEDRYIDLPTGASSYFGVVHKGGGREDEDLTRQIFGGTRLEFEAVTHALARVAGRSFQEMLHLPRLTFSKTRSNRCDVSGCLITQNFPYVAFDNAQYDWSHVSLHSLYRLLSFLCSPGAKSPVQVALEDAGISGELVRRFVDNGVSARPIYPHERDW